MNAVFIRLTIRDGKTFIFATPKSHTLQTNGPDTEYEVNEHTSYFLNGVACKKEDLKQGFNLVVSGKPALTVAANNFTRPA